MSFIVTVVCDGKTVAKAAQVIRYQFPPSGRFSQFVIHDELDPEGRLQLGNWKQGPQGKCQLVTADGRSADIRIEKTRVSDRAPHVFVVEFTPLGPLEE